MVENPKKTLTNVKMARGIRVTLPGSAATSIVGLGAIKVFISDEGW